MGNGASSQLEKKVAQEAVKRGAAHLNRPGAKYNPMPLQVQAQAQGQGQGQGMGQGKGQANMGLVQQRATTQEDIYSYTPKSPNACTESRVKLPWREQDTRIAIIGGGISGLTLANRLLLNTAVPLDVTIFEKDNDVGGKLNSQIIEDNYAIDHGVHLFNDPSQPMKSFLHNDSLVRLKTEQLCFYDKKYLYEVEENHFKFYAPKNYTHSVLSNILSAIQYTLNFSFSNSNVEHKFQVRSESQVESIIMDEETMGYGIYNEKKDLLQDSVDIIVFATPAPIAYDILKKSQLDMAQINFGVDYILSQIKYAKCVSVAIPFTHSYGIELPTYAYQNQLFMAPDEVFSRITISPPSPEPNAPRVLIFQFSPRYSDPSRPLEQHLNLINKGLADSKHEEFSLLRHFLLRLLQDKQNRLDINIHTWDYGFPMNLAEHRKVNPPCRDIYFLGDWIQTSPAYETKPGNDSRMRLDTVYRLANRLGDEIEASLAVSFNPIVADKFERMFLAKFEEEKMSFLRNLFNRRL